MKEKLIFDIEEASDSYIESFVRKFIKENSSVINNLSTKIYDASELSSSAFQEIIFAELQKACYSFVNNKHNATYINSYLYACIYKTIKSIKNEGKHNVHICPGCKFFSRIEVLDTISKKLYCNFCRNALNNLTEKWEEEFYKTFSEHSRKGYRCPECDNFIPDSGKKEVSCPYPSCIFAGNIDNLKILKHPTIKANLEIPLNIDPIEDSKSSSDTYLLLNEDIKYYLKILNECINFQMETLHFKTNESTLINKLCMYQSYKNMIERYPNDMVSYLVLLNRNVKIQHKIFQEFIKLLEEKIPFSFKKNGKIYTVNSLLDDNLCIFDGISEFDGVVDDKLEVPNLTEELYVGGRKGSYCRPYYLGKIVDVIDLHKNISLISNIKNYSFFKINFENISPNTKVRIKHYRIYPHYQMGGMVYLNRIRRIIVDKVYFEIHSKKRIAKR